MGLFDPTTDTPFQIKIEGEQIKLEFARGVPTTSQGTITWNIPPPAHGCQTTEGGIGAYCGIVILLSTEPLSAENRPQDGARYFSDPTADPDLHTGDKIGNALVIGSFYEAEKKANNQPLTTSFIVSNLKPNIAYFVAGYAVDCTYHYHGDGIRAYSSEFGKKDEPGTNAYQTIRVSEPGECTLPSDSTGLLDGAMYAFDLFINGDVHNIKINGTYAPTYGELITEINKSLKTFGDDVIISPEPPNSNTIFWDTTESKLYLFDGTTFTIIDTIVENKAPADVQIGDYWYDTANNILRRWNIPNPSGWNVVDIINYGAVDPENLSCDDYWFNGTQGYRWCDTTWCERPTYVSAVDPLAGPVILCCSYWYDTVNLTLYKRNEANDTWEEVSAIYWDFAPDNLPDLTYWFNLTDNTLYQMIAGSWSIQTVTIQETPPFAVDGKLWYQESTETLYRYDIGTTQWVIQSVLVWADDPSDVESCELWWNSTNELLYTWDSVHAQWDEVSFIQSDTDPTLPPSNVEVDTLWYDTANSLLYSWDGSNWIIVKFANNPTDPLIVSIGNARTTEGKWYIYGVPNVNVWNEIDPIEFDSDPNFYPTGTYWFDTLNNRLYVRNGLLWVNVIFTTTNPSPQRNTKWYDSSNDVLYQWIDSQWTEIDPEVYIEFDQQCNLVFKTLKKGSSARVTILNPNFNGKPASYGSGYADDESVNTAFPTTTCGYYGGKPLPDTGVSRQGFLFNNIIPAPQIQPCVMGTDGVSGTPSYAEIGIGDDGTPDEKRELARSIREQLGYPSVEVELTTQQLNTAIELAIEMLRQKSSAAYKKKFFFMDIKPRQQHYILTNKAAGFDKIVNVMGAYRFTSAFLSTAGGSGVYGQVVLQHLYNMGTFDLVSYHLVSQYIEQLEHLFATRLTFVFDEHERKLSFFDSFIYPERVILDATTEKTVQEILVDRMTKPWVEKWALAESMYMLAQIRGKYSSLPGAGGGISLNASDLYQQATDLKNTLLQEIDDFIASDPESLGIGATFIIG